MFPKLLYSLHNPSAVLKTIFSPFFPIKKNRKSCSECVHELAPVSKFLIDKLNNIEIKCKYWYNGCDKILKLPQIGAHEKKCDKVPDKEFNDQEDLLFECPQGCHKLCTLPEIKGKHSCVFHLQDRIVHLDEQYSSYFTNNIALGKENDQIENSLASKEAELKALIAQEKELNNEMSRLENERNEKVAELSKYTIENMEETYSKIQENFGENLMTYPFTKAQHEELFKGFSANLTKDMNDLLKFGQENQKELLDGLQKNLMRDLTN